MNVADALSRNYPNKVPNQETPDSEIDCVIHSVISDLSIKKD